jgi:RsiW-degrading membrane proteinase PrsW (M82 family)
MDVVLGILMVFLSLITSSIPMFFYVWFVWWLDHHDREPLLLIAAAFLWGAVASIVISIVFEVVFSLPFMLFSEGVQDVAGYVVLAPVIEELSKSVILFALFFHRRFNRVLDGVVYGAVVGFGFASSENLLYYLSTYLSQGVGAWAVVVILRTVFTSLGHAVYTSLIGAGVGLMKFSRQRWMRFVFPPLAILTAIVLHGLFNVGALFTEFYSLTFFLLSAVVLFFALAAVGFIMFLALHDESACIRTQLSEEVDRGVVSTGEYEIASSYLRRRRASFRVLAEYGYGSYRLADRLLQHEIDLAFAKDELSNAAGEIRRKEILKTVNDLRDSIRDVRRRLGEASALLRNH